MNIGQVLETHLSLASRALGFNISTPVFDGASESDILDTLDLANDQELTINGVSGGTNHLIIKDGEVWVSEATCPDKICVHQGKIHLDGEIIVCLPNKMTAQIKSLK